MKTFLKITFLFGFVFPLTVYSQENESTSISQIFEETDPKLEIVRLESKRDNLIYRLGTYKTDTTTYHQEIIQTEGMIVYIDKKIETLQHTITSEEFALKNGAPKKEGLSKEEYILKRQAWEDSLRSTNTNVDIPLKTTLTRYEFEKLPLPQQEKILSMPERYTIVD